MSILAVTAPATRRGLTTVAAVKRELGITGSVDHDFLEDLILQASAAIEGWCRRVFGREEVAETFRLSAERAVLHLARWPNVTLASIVEDVVTLMADDWELDAAFGHAPHQIDQLVVPAADRDLAGHDLGDVARAPSPFRTAAQPPSCASWGNPTPASR